MWILILQQKKSETRVTSLPTERPFSSPGISLNNIDQNLEKVTYKISFEKLPSPTPAAIELYLSFDPTALRLENIKEGDLWESTNILQKIIDNNKGSAVVSLGQGFGSKVTNKTTIMVAEFTHLDSSVENPEITIGSQSSMARVGEGKLISLQNLLAVSKMR